MQSEHVIDLILNGKKHTIPSKFTRLAIVSDDVYYEIMKDHKYVVHSNVTDDVFQSFINFWTNEEEPEIMIENVHEYDLLYREFGIIGDLLLKKRESWGTYFHDLNNLNDPMIIDKSNTEEMIARQLDDYLLKNGTNLMNSPITNLINIFSHPDRKFTQQNLAYELIIDHYEKDRNNYEILSLLQFINGSNLNEKNMKDAIQNADKRIGMIPKIEYHYIEQIKENFDEFYEKQEEINENNNEKRKSIETMIDELLKKIENLEEKLNDQNKHNYEEFSKIKKTVNNQKEKQNEINQEQINKNEQIFTQFSKQEKKLNDFIDKQNAQNDEFENQNQNIMNDIKDKINNINQILNSRLKKIQETEEEQNNSIIKLDNKINEESNKIKKHKKEIDFLKKEIEKSKEEANEKKQELDKKLDNQIKTINQQKIDIQNNKNRIDEVIKIINDNNDEQNNKYKTLETKTKQQFSSQKSDIEKALKTEMDKNNRQISKMNDTISNYQKVINDNNDEQNNKYKTLETNTRQQLILQKSEIEKSLNTEIDKNNRQISKINDAISNYQKVNNDLKAKIEFLEEQTSKISDIQKQTKKIQQNNEKIIKENQQNNEKMIKENQQNNEKAIKDVQDQINNYNVSLQQIQKENEDKNNNNKEIYDNLNNKCCNLKIFSELISNYIQRSNLISFLNDDIHNLSFYRPISASEDGILSSLRKLANNDYKKKFIVLLSSHDPYNLLLKDSNDRFNSGQGENAYIEFIFRIPKNLTGFEIEANEYSILRNYDIIINDGPVFKSITDDITLRDEHKSRFNFEAIKCSKFKIVHKGPNWDENKNSISLKRIEFFTTTHPEGLIEYWNKNYNSIPTCKALNDKDPHLFPIKIQSHLISTDCFHDLNPDKYLCTSQKANEYCEIKFIDGAVLVDGYRLKRSYNKYKMKGWKIIGQTLLNEEKTLFEYTDNDPNSDPLYISPRMNNSSYYMKSIKIYNTLENFDKTGFLFFLHFDIFGQYVKL
ncbi:hypothetical protein M9Y10_020613 [Tritrichomonas musculus]|uniref:Uncharacterized protein n=1 Tax=Tritrichomonas musculus TaxID=1915356 RepID=A0ABR2HE61_9EUKA